MVSAKISSQNVLTYKMNADSLGINLMPWHGMFAESVVVASKQEIEGGHRESAVGPARPIDKIQC